MHKTVGLVALVALSGAEAFAPAATGPALRARAAPAVCALSATSADAGVSRRAVLSSAVFAAAGLASP
jgi:hypothetical protein